MYTIILAMSTMAYLNWQKIKQNIVIEVVFIQAGDYQQSRKFEDVSCNIASSTGEHNQQ